MFTLHQVVIVLLLVIASGTSDHVATAESAAGFAINSTIAVSPLPKELIDPKASEQVLELIVKIAEHPATWKQIHRVLETLEANNAAYSQRIDVTRSELGWINKRLDSPGDKRNDVPDEKIAFPLNITSTSSSSLETAFQRWRDVLFASVVPKEPALHPQLQASEMHSSEKPRTEQGVKEYEWSSSIPPNQPEQLRAEKKFEDRLNEIEEELKKLTKLSRMMPLRLKQLAAIAGHQQEKRIKLLKSSSKNVVAHQSENATEILTVAHKSHPKFQYHRVHNTTNQPGLPSPGNLLGPNFWKKIASLKHNGSNPSSRRNSFVAVSISPPAIDTSKGDESLLSIGHQGVLATEPVKSELSKPCKKNHSIRKSKQRQLPNRRVTNKKIAEDLNG